MNQLMQFLFLQMLMSQNRADTTGVETQIRQLMAQIEEERRQRAQLELELRQRQLELERLRAAPPVVPPAAPPPTVPPAVPPAAPPEAPPGILRLLARRPLLGALFGGR
jgi:outer membrane protein TolC